MRQQGRFHPEFGAAFENQGSITRILSRCKIRPKLPAKRSNEDVGQAVRRFSGVEQASEEFLETFEEYVQIQFGVNTLAPGLYIIHLTDGKNQHIYLYYKPGCTGIRDSIR